MKILINCSVLLISFLLISCERNERLQPPSNGKKVLIKVKLPSDLDVLPLGVMYRSEICHEKRNGSDGKSHEEPGFNFTEMNLKRQGNSSEYDLFVPFDGGGQCNWKLSNVTIDIQYSSDTFKEKIDHVVGAGIIVIFDNNPPQRDDGVYENVTGDLFISKNYFPWINERFLNGRSRDLWTYGKRLYSTYKTKDTYRVVFSPESNSNIITYSIGQKAKNRNGQNFTKYIYPNGEIVDDGGAFPEFDKLESIASNNLER